MLAFNLLPKILINYKKRLFYFLIYGRLCLCIYVFMYLCIYVSMFMYDSRKARREQPNEDRVLTGFLSLYLAQLRLETD